MFWSIYHTRKDTPWPMKVDESRLFKRFFFIVATNCASLIPTVMLKCFSLAGYVIPGARNSFLLRLYFIFKIH
jgi:hypothetical protein